VAVSFNVDTTEAIYVVKIYHSCFFLTEIMSVFLATKSITPDIRKKIEEDCIIEYETSYGNKETKSVQCYVKSDKGIAVPFNWCWRNLRITNDYETKVYNYTSTLPYLNQEQEDVTNEVIDTLTRKRTAALLARTGSGKTAVSLFAACKFKGRTVIIVSDKTLEVQWISSIEKYTTAKCCSVDINGSAIDDDVAIIVCMYTRWGKVSKYIRTNISLLIVDECDTRYNKTGMESILSFNPLRILVCTATFNKVKTSLESTMKLIVGNNNFVARGFDVAFEVYKFNTNIMGLEKKQRGKYNVDFTKLKQSLLYNDARNELIVKVILLLLEEGRKIMVIASETKHVDLLVEMLDNKGVNVDYLYGKKTTIKNCDVLVGGTKKCGRGFDEESYCPGWDKRRIDCVVRVDFRRDPSQLIQENGRAFRAKNPRIVHFVDRNGMLVNQWKACKSLYESYDAKIISCKLE